MRWKKIALEASLVITAALAAFFFVAQRNVPVPAFAPDTSSHQVYDFNPSTYMAEPRADWTKFWSLAHEALTHKQLLVFGSSELTVSEPPVIYNYVPRLCGTRVLAIGHAGYQSLTILMDLLRLDSSLRPDSRIVIILSAGWYNENGTSTERFLDNTTAPELVNLAADPDMPELTSQAIDDEVRTHRDEISSLSPVWMLWSFPFMRSLLVREGLLVKKEPVLAQVRLPPMPALISPDQDLKNYREQAEAQLKANPLGVSDEYWNHVKNKPIPQKADALDFWAREEKDTYALSDFLRHRGIHALFVIQAKHKGFAKDWSQFDRLMERLTVRLNADGHSVFNTFKDPFDKTWLKDIGHFSDYGWIRVDQEVCKWLHSN